MWYQGLIRHERPVLHDRPAEPVRAAQSAVGVPAPPAGLDQDDEMVQHARLAVGRYLVVENHDERES